MPFFSAFLDVHQNDFQILKAVMLSVQRWVADEYITEQQKMVSSMLIMVVFF
jgi:hypothetical protein